MRLALWCGAGIDAQLFPQRPGQPLDGDRVRRADERARRDGDALQLDTSLTVGLHLQPVEFVAAVPRDGQGRLVAEDRTGLGAHGSEMIERQCEDHLSHERADATALGVEPQVGSGRDDAKPREVLGTQVL